ncbi:hypothetical protein DYB32_003041 [Aphanomyces invadans]|uniref:Uncharacterized protein n=1 Tax=Aphanomyces invadans TaxID=157072 RepID=A0A3R6ZT29_9STRA|nr:hypothetical protein DYB32_003041 [Aphanomyces invadans]
MFQPSNASTTFDRSSKPVPWHTNDYARSTITPNPAMCPKLKWIDAAWRSSSEYVNWVNSAANTQLERDTKRVLSNYDHATLYDCLMTSKYVACFHLTWLHLCQPHLQKLTCALRCTDRALPTGIDDDLFRRMTTREESVQIQQYLYNQSAYAQAGMAAYTKRIRDRAIAASRDQGPRFVLSAGMDLNPRDLGPAPCPTLPRQTHTVL